tara:strand:- start:201 stop:392 length:192 start_codon:yes stop_codon:yes gene_type:complete
MDQYIFLFLMFWFVKERILLTAKLSITKTECPLDFKAMARLCPMNPAPPIRATLFFDFLICIS